MSTTAPLRRGRDASRPGRVVSPVPGLIVDRYAVDGRVLGVARTTVATGDLRIDGAPVALEGRRRAVAGALGDPSWPWVWLRQVHGARVVRVRRDDVGAVRGSEADALVTDDPGLLLAVHTADCAPVALLGDAGVVGVAHAGWRGLEAGVLGATVEAMRSLGATRITARLGPCIHAECYEFGSTELDGLAARFGDSVRGTTATGAPALDVPATVAAALGALDVPLDVDGGCTACAPDRSWSHRARGDVGRMAQLVWIEP